MSEQDQEQYRRGYRAHASGTEYDPAGGQAYRQGWMDSSADHSEPARGKHARPVLDGHGARA